MYVMTDRQTDKQTRPKMTKKKASLMCGSKTNKIFRASCHKIQFIGQIFQSLNLHDCDLSLIHY